MEWRFFPEGSISVHPGKIYAFKRNNFLVSDRRKAHLCLPIDDFFESLADEAGERSIAVILSGAGTDGARGIQSVRMMGGTVFVQDPETAEFRHASRCDQHQAGGRSLCSCGDRA